MKSHYIQKKSVFGITKLVLFVHRAKQSDTNPEGNANHASSGRARVPTVYGIFEEKIHRNEPFDQ